MYRKPWQPETTQYGHRGVSADEMDLKKQNVTFLLGSGPFRTKEDELHGAK